MIPRRAQATVIPCELAAAGVIAPRHLRTAPRSPGSFAGSRGRKKLALGDRFVLMGYAEEVWFFGTADGGKALQCARFFGGWKGGRGR